MSREKSKTIAIEIKKNKLKEMRKFCDIFSKYSNELSNIIGEDQYPKVLKKVGETTKEMREKRGFEDIAEKCMNLRTKTNSALYGDVTRSEIIESINDIIDEINMKIRSELRDVVETEVKSEMSYEEIIDKVVDLLLLDK